MKSIYPILSFLLASAAFGSRIDYPVEYLVQKSGVIIVGEIVKMDYDIKAESPHGNYYYSLAYIRIDEILKSDVELKKESHFTFRVESRIGGYTSASIFWDKGNKGTWFFRRVEGEDWLYETLKPVETAEEVKRELTYKKKRKFQSSFSVRRDRFNARWPESWGQRTSLSYLITTINQMAIDFGELSYQYPGKTPVQVRIQLGEHVDPELEVGRMDLGASIESILEEIREQNPDLDFEYLENTILIFNRTKAEQGGGINSEAAPLLDTP